MSGSICVFANILERPDGHNIDERGPDYGSVFACQPLTAFIAIACGKYDDDDEASI